MNPKDEQKGGNKAALNQAPHDFARALLLLIFVVLVILSGLYGPDFLWRTNHAFGPDTGWQRTGSVGGLDCTKTTRDLGQA
jgi:hypothetical protein